MPTSRRFRSLRRGSGTRQKTTWNQRALQFALGTVGGVVFADLTPKPLSITGEVEHGTAVLMRFIASFQMNQETLITNVPQSFAIGVYVSSIAAISATTILAPLSNEDQDWYYWTARSTFTEDVPQAGPTWEIDIRSKRRLRSGYGLVMTVEPLAANTADLELTVGLRLLWAISN